MIEIIKNFFVTFSDLLTSCFDMLVEFATSGQQMGALMWLLVSRIPVFFSWMPGICLAVLMQMFAFAVLYKIFGRS